jgi:formylglycine-generating enzyme required for sulfatase activity
MKLGHHPLSKGAAPEWAAEWGADARGVFASFAVGDVVHRMRWVRAGSFVMGSPEGEAGRWPEEDPTHWVKLTKGYWLGETPVTQTLWEAVMASNPSKFIGPMRPVENVSWDDCVGFIEALNVKVAGLAVRLPTEAEWEHACRAGTVGATWLGSNDVAMLDRIAWYDGNSGQQTHEVCGKEPNPIGLHDMLGNVWEWCSDWHGPYASDSITDPWPAITDPSGINDGSSRVMRGGSWGHHARYIRAACRACDPHRRYASIGLRLARGSL